MIKALVIDDEPLARSVVREYLQDFPEIRLVAECGDGFEGLKAIQQFQPDLVFLDVQMPKINGFEMLELLDNPPPVIFITAFDEYAMKAFDANATDYLLKPFSKERFEKSIRKFTESGPAKYKTTNEGLLDAVAGFPGQNHRIVVKTGSRILIIPVDEVCYLEAADDYVKIHTRNGSYLKNRTLSFFEKTLDPESFVRTHRSYILNLREITRIEPLEKENFVAILRSGVQVPVSRSGYPRLKATLGW